MGKVSPKTVEEQIRKDIKSGKVSVSDVGFETDSELIGIFLDLAEEYNRLKPVILEIQECESPKEFLDLDREELNELYDGEESLEVKGAEVERLYMKLFNHNPEAIEHLIKNNNYHFLHEISDFVNFTDWEGNDT